MKVTKWTTRVLQTPADNPLVVGIDQPGTREFVTLELDTDEGLQGIGVTFFGGPLTPALRTAVDNLCEFRPYLPQSKPLPAALGGSFQWESDTNERKRVNSK